MTDVLWVLLGLGVVVGFLAVVAGAVALVNAYAEYVFAVVFVGALVAVVLGITT